MDTYRDLLGKAIMSSTYKIYVRKLYTHCHHIPISSVSLCILFVRLNRSLLLLLLLLLLVFEPPHDKTNKTACAPSKTSNWPGHLPSLIRVFAVCMKKAWVLSYPLSASEESDQKGRMPRLIGVFTRYTVVLLVLSCGSSHY